jgi:hypothetical protein
MSKHSTFKDKNPPDSLLFQALLSEGNTEKALELSEKILQESRNLEERDFEAEAWIRMERALLGAIEPANVGNELRWCVDRFASMALVTLADISSDAGHPVDLIGLSRLESGRILSSIGDLEPAMRHLWMAMRRLSSSEMRTEAVVCAMEWLDIALDEVDPDSPTMDERILGAKPREKPGMTTIPSNPNDIKESVELILSIALKDVSGDNRDDLGLVLDASETIEEPKWREAIEERRSEIQDPRLIEVLQS